jgi:hypothetical protein
MGELASRDDDLDLEAVARAEMQPQSIAVLEVMLGDPPEGDAGWATKPIAEALGVRSKASATHVRQARRPATSSSPSASSLDALERKPPTLLAPVARMDRRHQDSDAMRESRDGASARGDRDQQRRARPDWR